MIQSLNFKRGTGTSARWCAGSASAVADTEVAVAWPFEGAQLFQCSWLQDVYSNSVDDIKAIRNVIKCVSAAAAWWRQVTLCPRLASSVGGRWGDEMGLKVPWATM